MKIKALLNFNHDGRVYRPGEVLDIPDQPGVLVHPILQTNMARRLTDGELFELWDRERSQEA